MLKFFNFFHFQTPFRNSDESLLRQFAETYLIRGKHKVNFIAVNWRKGSTTINYFAARKRVKSVAEHLANLINFMISKHKLKLKDVTVVGHSLGAHVAGIGEHDSIVVSLCSLN